MSGRKPKKNASRPDAADRYYVPYTADELAESRGQRKFLNAVNVLNARLWMCVHFAECACEAIRAGDHYRAYSYFRALDIGNEFVSASIASAIQRIREQIISNGEGNAPVAGSVNGLVKVLATYIQLRLEIHATDSIIRADRAGRSIADMLTSHALTRGGVVPTAQLCLAHFRRVNGLANIEPREQFLHDIRRTTPREQNRHDEK